jgi:hypothetical protein
MPVLYKKLIFKNILGGWSVLGKPPQHLSDKLEKQLLIMAL